jgi:hypothetical protein
LEQSQVQSVLEDRENKVLPVLCSNNNKETLFYKDVSLNNEDIFLFDQERGEVHLPIAVVVAGVWINEVIERVTCVVR